MLGSLEAPSRRRRSSLDAVDGLGIKVRDVLLTELANASLLGLLEPTPPSSYGGGPALRLADHLSETGRGTFGKALFAEPGLLNTRMEPKRGGMSKFMPLLSFHLFGPNQGLLSLESAILQKLLTSPSFLNRLNLFSVRASDFGKGSVVNYLQVSVPSTVSRVGPREAESLPADRVEP